MAELVGTRKSRGTWADIIRAASSIFRADELSPTEMEELATRMEEFQERADLSGVIPGAGVIRTPLKMMKTPGKILALFRKFAGTESPTDSAIGFGYAFRKSSRVRETLEKARKVVGESYEKAPRGSQARQEHAFVGQLLREAGEEAAGKTPKGFSYLEQKAKRKVWAEKKKLLESGVHFLP